MIEWKIVFHWFVLQSEGYNNNKILKSTLKHRKLQKDYKTVKKSCSWFNKQINKFAVIDEIDAAIYLREFVLYWTWIWRPAAATVILYSCPLLIFILSLRSCISYVVFVFAELLRFLLLDNFFNLFKQKTADNFEVIAITEIQKKFVSLSNIRPSRIKWWKKKPISKTYYVANGTLCMRKYAMWTRLLQRNQEIKEIREKKGRKKYKLPATFRKFDNGRKKWGSKEKINEHFTRLAIPSVT